ncbi:ABC transporter ATP-binding protein [Phytoactinopolyspora halotolerans]|uniref:ABC transporter ATP-binding protein n=1 Tax=Phytoactinopolyspora halotolerans TaxID=1981512 RepID=A0A6L9S867_9ACTN|nr:ABC transporter ATP-binding protein [Phytoactinopolyspora halotolerans]
MRIGGLGVRYPDGHLALDGVSVVVHDGETVAVVGGSGSGKSTLVRAVLGLLPAGTVVAGSISLEGVGDLTRMRDRELRGIRGRHIGYVAQDPYASADPWWTVGHHVGEAWRVHRLRVPAQEIVARVATLGVDDARTRLGDRPATWSGGMLQRADIVAATAHRPRLIVADEPTSALDVEVARTALAALVAQSRSLLLVSHDLDMVAEHADRIVVLDGGRIAQELIVGRRGAHALQDAASHPATRRLLAALPGSVARPARPAARVGSGVEAADSEVVAALEDVTLAYSGGDAVVAGVDLRIAAGEVVGLCGPSGAGKSTVLRALAGLLRPVSGTVRHGDVALWTDDGTRPRPGFVMPIFQDAAASLNPRWPIWKTVAEATATTSLGNRRLSAPDVRRRAYDLLRSVGLGDVDPQARPRRLSGGQRQRVAVARAMGGGAALVVADEPTAALDTVYAQEIVDLLRALADSGCALAVVSHDERRLRSFAGRVLRVADGTVTPD